MLFHNILLTSYETLILRLISEQTGDQFRLEDMLVRSKAGKKLYESDISYIQRLSPKVIEKPVVFTEEPYVHKEIPKIKNKRTGIIVLIVVISIALAIVSSLILFTDLGNIDKIIETFCEPIPGKLCLGKPHFQDFPQEYFERFHDRITELLN